MTQSAIVVGSGPAAAATVHALLQSGWQVTVLDVGYELESENREAIDRMAAQPASEWSEADKKRITHRPPPVEGINHSKRSYGSDFAFRDEGNLLAADWQRARSFHHSFAFGGLSNVWGSCMLPYAEQDLDAWPIRLRDLEDHYRAVMELVPCTSSGDDDPLESILPSYSSQHNPIRPGAQGRAFLNDLENSRSHLAQHGISGGKARLAIRATDYEGSPLCRYCNLCLSGCPDRLIYSSAQSFSTWISRDQIRYLPGHLVERVEETDSGSKVHGIRLAGKEPFRMEAGRVFLATGVLATAKILQSSRTDLPRRIRLLDSQYFIFPLLRFRAVGDVETEPAHTAAQVFLEINDKAVSKHLVHLQIYGYSAFLRDEVLRGWVRFPLRWTWLRKQFFSRLLIVQGFLHSEDSGHLQITTSPGNRPDQALQIRPVRDPSSIRTIILLGLKLLANSLRLRALVLPLWKLPPPGSGYHSGGSFPMSRNPEAGQTDTLGRPVGWKFTHIVDSSTFPSIPATSITMSVMANAHRIASLATRSAMAGAPAHELHSAPCKRS